MLQYLPNKFSLITDSRFLAAIH